MQSAPELRDYVGLLWRRRLFILVITAVVFGVAMLYTSRQTPVYDSAAQILVEPIEIPNGAPGFTTQNMDTEVRIATSPDVSKIATETLDAQGIPIGSISVSAPDGEFTLVFQGSGTTPKSAKATTQAYADAYLINRQDLKEVELDALKKAKEAEITKDEGEIAALQPQYEQAVVDENDQLAFQILSQIDDLQEDIHANGEFLEQIEFSRAASVGDLLVDAYLPGGRTSPNLGQTGILAIFLGFSLGVGAVFVRDRMDPSVRRRGEVETSARAPLLAAIPEGEGPGRIMVTDDPHGITAEAYRALRARVLFAVSQDPMKTFMISSYLHGEGKTTTAVNLAIALAESGRSTALVGADLHRPDLANYFDVGEHPGLSAILANALDVDNAVMPTAIQNLEILASGPHVPNPAELLGTDALTNLVDELEKRFDFVVIDAPPVVGTSDALTIAPHAHGVILVANAQRSTPATIEEAALELRSVGANVIGVVMTRLGSRSEYVYARYYRDYRSYHEREPYQSNGHGILPRSVSSRRRRSSEGSDPPNRG
jgi:capsular exopolysaccharide synthesis family protein